MIKLRNCDLFLNKISVQEASLGKFICSQCSTFCTNLKTDYEDHLREDHADYDQVSCIYCAVSFEFSKISNHIESHFEEETLLSANICNLCSKTVKMDNQESVLEHLMFHHNNDRICPLCKMEYTECSELIEHINDNLKTHYHCTFEGCQVKTNNNEELNSHKNISGHISDSCFEEHIFNCLTNGIENKFSLIDNVHEIVSKHNNNGLDIDSDGVTDKEKFDYIWKLNCRKELIDETFKNIDSVESSKIQDKLFSVEQFSVGVSFSNEKKLYSCLECDYPPQYSHWDVKRHILMLHCSMTYRDSRRCLMLVEFNKLIEKELPCRLRVSKAITKSLVNKKLTTANGGVVVVNRLVALNKKFDFILHIHYRREMFSQIFRDSPSSAVIRKKLNTIDKYSIGVIMTDSKKVFYCLNCNYISYHSHWDVRKHIFSWHCSIATRDSKKCMKLIRLVEGPSSVRESCFTAITAKRSRSGTKKHIKTELLSINGKPARKSLDNDIKGKSNKFNRTLKLCCHMELFDTIFRGCHANIRRVLRSKLTHIDQFSVGLKLVNSKRSFHCMRCDYASHHSHWDVRKHILVWHCGISSADSHKCIKLLELLPGDEEEDGQEKVEIEGIVEEEEQETDGKEGKAENEHTAVPFETPYYSGNGTLMQMTYQEGSVASFFPGSTDEFVADLERKMEIYRQCRLEMVILNGIRYFVCIICGYKSQHNQGDVKKHVMARHCGIAGYLVRDIIKLCKKDPTEERSTPVMSAIEKSTPTKRCKNRTSRRSCPQPPPPIVPTMTNEKPAKRPDKSEPLARPIIHRRRTTMTTTSSSGGGSSSGNGAIKKPRLVPLSNIDDPKKILIERDICLRYSEVILRNLCAIEKVETEQLVKLTEQMKRTYCQIRVRVGKKFDSPIYICSKCNWFTWKSIGLVSDHIVAMHTGIGEQLVPLVEMSTKLNESGELLSDSEISRIGWNGRAILFHRRSNLFTNLGRL